MLRSSSINRIFAPVFTWSFEAAQCRKTVRHSTRQKTDSLSDAGPKASAQVSFYFGSGRGVPRSPDLRNQRLAPESVLKKFSNSAVVFAQPTSLECRRSARTSFCVQVSPSSLRGELPQAHRYGPHTTSGVFTSPRTGS